MNWRKVGIVAAHEFGTTVRRWAFLVVTLVVPVFFGGLYVLSWATSVSSVEAQVDRISGARLFILDHSKLFDGDFPEKAGERWTRVTDLESGMAGIIGSKEPATLVVIPKDYLESGHLNIQTTLPASLMSPDQIYAPWPFRTWMARQLAGPMENDLFHRVRHPVRRESVTHVRITPEGMETEDFQEYLQRIMTGGAFFLFFFMSIMSSGGYLIQGVADEKENRVLEMVLSSLRPVELMWGKLIGLGGAGLLQMLIWSVIGVSTALLAAVSVLVAPGPAFLCALFFLLGYLLNGSLMLALGSLGTNMREATQYTMAISLLSVAPLFFLPALITEPSGTAARILSYIPFTAPLTMIIRHTLDADGIPLWEMLLVIVLLAGTTLLGLTLAARLYRVGILLYGKRPSLREVWRWLRESGA